MQGRVAYVLAKETDIMRLPQARHVGHQGSKPDKVMRTSTKKEDDEMVNCQNRKAETEGLDFTKTNKQEWSSAKKEEEEMVKYEHEKQGRVGGGAKLLQT